MPPKCLSRSHHPARLIGLGAAAALIACVVLALSRSAVIALGVAVPLGALPTWGRARWRRTA